jgi:chromosome condensin MukBEF MukE localization factor
MRRLFWLTVGAGMGVYATRRVSRFARRLTPGSVAVRASDRVRMFAEDVRLGMQAREEQLREATELERAVHDPAQEQPRRMLKARYTIIDDEKDGY